MRSHPVVGSLFILLGVALLAGGAFASGAPAPLDELPIPAHVVVPFVLWQLATWSILFGIFFLRPRARKPRPDMKKAQAERDAGSTPSGWRVRPNRH